MNTANLQLEGVYVILAALLEALMAKSVLNETELISILSEVERNILADTSRPAEVRGANVEAMLFPARFLKSALQTASLGRKPSFAEIVTLIRQRRAEPENAGG